MLGAVVLVERGLEQFRRTVVVISLGGGGHGGGRST